LRIAWVDGWRVPPYAALDLKVGSGIRPIGLVASAGSSSVSQCLTVMLTAGQRYLIRVAGPERKWAVSVVNEITGDELMLLSLVTMKSSCPEPK
jgi:hypothetical protein